MPMRKQLRTCRRRQKTHVLLKSTTQPRGLSVVTDKGCSHTLTRHSESDNIYLVETILGERIIKGQKYYHVRWKGFPPEADSWEPEKNLSNVLNIISDFRRCTKNSGSENLDVLKDFHVSKNSPSSVPTLPATTRSSLPYAVNCLRGSSEERQVIDSSKRKLSAKSRSGGKFVYVPKHELVALKTKYFDDVRDGKIDLSSNDLYSRVKTRKRCAGEAACNSISNESSTSHNGSWHEEVVPECDASTESSMTCEPKQEPSSPSYSFGMNESSKDFQFVLGEMEADQSKVLDNITKNGVVHENVSFRFSCSTSNISKHSLTSSVSKFTQTCCSYPKTTSPIVASDGGFHHKLITNEVALSPMPTTSYDESDANKPVYEVTNHQNTKPTVSSLRTLVQLYFNIILSHCSKIQSLNKELSSGNLVTMMNESYSDLQSLPTLSIYAPSMQIRTGCELIDAIKHHRWSLLTSPLPSLTPSVINRSVNATMKSSQFANNREHGEQQRQQVEESLIACITNGAGRPIILHKLLNMGLDLDNIVENDSKLPLLLLAVRLGRIHVAQALLDAGVKPNSVDPSCRQRTALGVAIADGDVDMANMLILSGANFYEVEPGTTALSLIVRLLQAHTTQLNSKSNSINRYGSIDCNQNCNLNHNTNSDSGNHSYNHHVNLKSMLTFAELYDKLHSNDCHFPPIPLPPPPNGLELHTLSKPLVYNALMSSCTTTATIIGPNSQTNSIALQPGNNNKDFYESKNCLPSIDSLRRIYELVAAHHARLSMSVSNLVRSWLIRANLIQMSLISPCQWISLNERKTSIKFSWPNRCNRLTSDRVITPILILVHGQITPPACYDVWMDDDGPCHIERVCLDQVYVQKPLNRFAFVTTLFPLNWGSNKLHEHEVSIDFINSTNHESRRSHMGYQSRPTCVAVMVIAVALAKTM